MTIKRVYPIVISFCSLALGIYCVQEKPVQRIISLGPTVTEQLYILGAGDRIIANTIYCKRPTEAEKKEKIGSVVKVNIEKIVALKPDIVLATTLTHPKAVEKLKNLKINVSIIPTPANFDEICDNFLQLGKLIGKEELAKKIINDAKKQVELIRKNTEKLAKPKVIVQLGTKPLWVATKKSFINDFIEFAGGINIGPSGKSGLYTREQVVKQNPDVIIIVTMGLVGKKEKKAWMRYNTINAVKNKRIYIMDSYKLCSPNPVSFVETLKELVEILHHK